MYTLPKIWMGRIQKYWDKFMPTDFPASASEFSLKFDTPEVKDAVEAMEASLETEDPVIAEFIPENNVLSGYVGTYNVTGEPGVLTLLSPEPVNSNNIIALHYNAEEDKWEQIEDATVINGYAWGTLDSFSPIALFTYRKDIHIESTVNVPAITNVSSFLVCEGNTVKIYLDENNKVMVSSESTGTVLELTERTIVIGGSADGTPIDKTNIFVKGLKNNSIVNKVIGGSIYIKDGFTTVGEVNVTGKDTVIGALTGSYGAVKTMKVNFDLDNVLLSFFGCGEGYRQIGTINPSFASRCWAKDVSMNLKDVRCSLAFLGQNCEYFYVDSTSATVEGGNFDYFILGGSNDGTKDTSAVLNNAKIGIFQTTNRGNVANAKATFAGCSVENLFVGGDATDKSVTGTTGKLRYEINGSEGKYNIVNGTEAGALLTNADIVDVIKVSRAADITIDDELKAILGCKYIVK
jgi:hypothetical protein